MASHPDEQSLLSRVLADPADQAAWEVWADWLAVHGDPRGELIALERAARVSLPTAAAARRARSIVAAHGVSWLGDLVAVVMRREGLRFERGLLTECRIQWQHLDGLPSVTGHPLWGSVRSIYFRDHAGDWRPEVAALLLHPVMRSLREVIAVGASEILVPLARSERPLPIEAAWAIAYHDGGAAAAEAVLSSPGLPSLRRLGLHVARPVDGETLLRSPLADRLERIAFSSPGPVGDWLALVERIGAGARSLELRPGWLIENGDYAPPIELIFERGADGRLSRLTIGESALRARSTAAGARSRLAAALSSIPDGALEAITFVAPEEPALREPVRRFARAEVRFGRRERRT